jgi:hypothetical protein
MLFGPLGSVVLGDDGGDETSYVDASVTIAAAASVTASGQLVAGGGLTVSAVSTVAASGQRVALGGASISAISAVTATGQLVANGAVLIEAVGAVSASAAATYAGSVVIAAQSDLVPSAAITATGSVTISAQSGIVVNGDLKWQPGQAQAEIWTPGLWLDGLIWAFADGVLDDNGVWVDDFISANPEVWTIQSVPGVSWAA